MTAIVKDIKKLPTGQYLLQIPDVHIIFDKPQHMEYGIHLMTTGQDGLERIVGCLYDDPADDFWEIWLKLQEQME